MTSLLYGSPASPPAGIPSAAVELNETVPTLLRDMRRRGLMSVPSEHGAATVSIQNWIGQLPRARDLYAVNCCCLAAEEELAPLLAGIDAAQLPPVHRPRKRCDRAWPGTERAVVPTARILRSGSTAVAAPVRAPTASRVPRSARPVLLPAEPGHL